ncbi:MAG: hypothetical protein ACR652_16115 [Methylocystis sp.]|uniref:hypothetical protein n=1 Tax=Methylocystis sp. TaxID=1911079 RepID=UPI003DA39464
MKMRFLVAMTLATVGWTVQAHAHGDVGSNQGQCLMKIGPDTMSFTGYQPLKSREQFCDDIPDAGPTIITLDAQQDELREMNLEMRVLRDVGQKDDNENLEANTEYFSPPKKYKTGTLTFDHNFATEGKYIGIVKAKSDDGSKEYVARFPFSVGLTASKELTTFLVLGAAGAVAFGLWYKHFILDKKKKTV